MNFARPNDLTPSQQVIRLLALSESHPKDSYNKEATALIGKYSAEKLFDPDTENFSGKNVLHYAIEVGDTANALALINKEGVSAEQLFHQERRFGYTPLHEAIAKDNKRVALALIDKADRPEHILCRNNEGKTAWQTAKEKHMGDVAVAIEKHVKNISKGQLHILDSLQQNSPVIQSRQIKRY